MKILACLVLLGGLAHADPMTFFVTSQGGPRGADLGGLAGADRHCQALARAAGAGERTWRAYLSAFPAGEQPIHARDRIGPGPWANAKGIVVARDLDELHSDRNRLDAHTVVTERGTELTDDHDILTGSDANGRLAFDKHGAPATCGDWSSVAGTARVGHSDRLDSTHWGNKRFPRRDGSWVSDHDSLGCDVNKLAESAGAGRVYCFAVADHAPVPVTPVVSRATFRRGVTINHWLGDNLRPSELPDSAYGASWFDEEDVAWIAARGFDHVRVLVNGGAWVNARGELDEARLAPFDRALGWAQKHGLGVVVAMHGLPGYRDEAFRGDPESPNAASPFTDEATRGDAATLWWLVARRYRDVGSELRFELLHAPTAKHPEHMRIFNAVCLHAIRRVSPTRTVYLTSYDMKIDSAGTVDLTDPRTALAVELWEPETFAFQTDPTRPLVRFVARDAALVAARLDSLRAEREIYVASFGVFRRADDRSAVAYLRTLVGAFARNKLAWAVYDYHTGCAVRAGGNGKGTRVLAGLGLEPGP